MTMIRPETEMKDTGIEWIGIIPSSWTIFPANGVFSEVKEKNMDLKLTNAFSFKYGEIVDKKQVGDVDNNLKETLSSYTIVRKNTIMINGLNLNYDFVSQRVAIVNESGVITSAYLAIQPDENKINPRFVLYLLKSYDYQQVFHGLGSGIRKTLKYQDFKKIMIVAPTLSEQQAIADYLDKTCSKIDEIIAEAKASIDEHKELKIGQINKYTIHKMKRTKLKYITEKIGDGIHATPEYSDEGTICFINGGSFGEDSIKMIGPMLSNEEYQKQNKSLLNEHTVMIALNGANFGNTSLYNNEAILLGKSAGYITLKSTVCREYVRYCLENSVTKEAFDLSLKGTTIPNLSLNTLRNTEICLPDYSVQKQLAKTIKKTIIKMDSLIAEKESLINDLEAYKKSLIYEVVTGKRRVV